MRVAFDATPLSVSTGGIRRYTLQLHAALQSQFPEDQFELVEPRPGRWWSAGLPRALRQGKFDVFHGTDFSVPYVPVVPAVMTVHDLSPWREEFAEETSPRVRRRTPWLLRLRLASHVITPTEAIRAELLAHFNLQPDRVRAIPHGVDARFESASAPVQDKNHPPYFLFVGTRGRRKNIGLAIATAQALSVELRIAGRGDWPQQPGVHLLGAVPDEALPELYAGAAALLFPALYEGFGLPALEAMACGTPVVASCDPALMEVCGGAALHADVSNPGEWRDAAQDALARRAHWSRLGLARAAQFSWERTAAFTRQLYQETMCHRAR